MNSFNIKVTVISTVGILILAAFAWAMFELNINNQSVNFESNIQTQVGVCATKIDSGYNTIVTNFNIAEAGGDQIRGYLDQMFGQSLDPNGDPQGAQTNLVASIMQYSVLGQTDLNELYRSVQDTVETVYSEWASCLEHIQFYKNEYAKLLGRPSGAVSGSGGAWPNYQISQRLNLPRQLQPEAATSPKRDLDGDGKLTVFDYPSVIVSALTEGTMENGTLPPLPLFGTETP
jgi:hypothetical protein